MKKLSLNGKIYFVLSVFVIACIGISFLGLRKLEESMTALNNIVNLNAARIQRVQEMRSLFYENLMYARDLVLADSDEKIHSISKSLESRKAAVEAKKVELHNILLPAGKKEILVFYEHYLNYYSSLMKIKEQKLQGNTQEATGILYEAAKIRITLLGMLDVLVKRNTDLMNSAVKKAEEDYSTSRWLMLVISSCSIVFGIGLATIILRTMSTTINQVIANLTDNSNQVTGAAQQIASSSEELSHAATEQASSLEETAASIEEMNSMVQKNAENALRAAELAVNSNNSAEKGKLVVGDMIKAISEISTSNNTIMVQVDESNQKISDIVKVIAEIGNKTKIINDIVFQTKLLSFNASVEAARAGEHGKGFAVVAEEVGNLAQMSGNAAKEISSMLDESIHKVESIVNDTKQKVSHLIQDGKYKVEAGSKIAVQCGDVLDEIVQNISNVTQMANEISTACQEQSQGVQEITKAMNQLDQVTQTNASTSEEAASAAEELASQADSLRNVVGILVKTIKGDKGDGHAPVAQDSSKWESQKKTSPQANVVHMRPKAKVQVEKKSGDATAYKKAAGFDNGSIPSENDPRFEDV